MDVKDISVLLKHHLKKHSVNLLEISNIQSMGNAMNFQSIFLFQNLMV